MRLTPEQWDDAADLLEQFAASCEIAYEQHDKDAKHWVRQRLGRLLDIATERSQHPRRSVAPNRHLAEDK